ncbi:MAG: BMP family protein [Myxococcota bacterium]
MRASVAWLGLIPVVAMACRGEPSSPPLEPSGASTFRVAMVLPGPIDDHSWSQAGYAALKRVSREQGIPVAHVANVSQARSEAVLREQARQGFDLVVAHGGEFVPAAETVAAEFPQVSFAVMTAYAGNNRNLGALSFRDSELGYLAGVVAALKSRSGKVAFIGGFPYPSTLEVATFFQQGASATHPGMGVALEWVGSWDDEDTARRLARQRMAWGADVLFVMADATALGVVDEAAHAGVYVIASNWDVHAAAPGTVVTSCLQHVDVLLREAVSLVQMKRWEGKQYKFGFREGAQELAPFRGQLTPEQVAHVERVRRDIMAGKVGIP